MKKLLSAVLVFAFASTANAGLIGDIESFTPTDTDGVNDNSNVIMWSETGDRARNNSFGFYIVDTATNTIKSTMTILGGAAHALSTSTVSWNFGDEANFATASNGNKLDATGATGWWQLGAFLNDGGTFHYSHSALNPNDSHRLNVSISSIFDGGLDFFWSGPGFQTMFVSGTDLEEGRAFGIPLELPHTTVPEPSALLLLGLGLLGLGLVRRNRKEAV